MSTSFFSAPTYFRQSGFRLVFLFQTTLEAIGLEVIGEVRSVGLLRAVPDSLFLRGGARGKGSMAPSIGRCKAFLWPSAGRGPSHLTHRKYWTLRPLASHGLAMVSRGDATRRIRAFLVAAMALSVAIAGGTPANAQPGAVCGRPGAPACPLQRWMRQRAAVAYAARDRAALVEVLDQAARLNPAPERWRQWGTRALAGASRVRRSGPGAALSACVSCHETFRTDYVRGYRQRRLPGTEARTPASPGRTNDPGALARD